MKTRHFFVIGAIAMALVQYAARVSAQTVHLDSISATTFCAGDPLSVTFTATGTWNHKNAFTLQLSNDSASFENGFTNLGSIQDTAPGTFTIVSSLPVNLVYRRFTISSHTEWKDSAYQVDTIIHVGGNAYDTMRMTKVTRIYYTMYDTTLPSHYRLRIMAANPYFVSADNGSDLDIGAAAIKFNFLASKSPDGTRVTTTPVITGVPTKFLIYGPGYVNLVYGDTVYWDFGDGADPATARTFSINGAESQTTYSTAGDKMVILRSVAPGGCSHTDTTHFYAFDCTPPTIPNDAIVISNDTALQAWELSPKSYVVWNDTTHSYDTVTYMLTDTAKIHPRTFWINPGVNVSAGSWTWDTLFVESGANVKYGIGNIIYLKTGATVSSTWNGAMICANGVSIDNFSAQRTPVLTCPGLTFDYTSAPPNSIMHINNAVAPSDEPRRIAVVPNPATGLVTLTGSSENAVVSVLNVLGMSMNVPIARDAPNTTIDLSSLVRGTYYVRVASQKGVVTEKIVKE